MRGRLSRVCVFLAAFVCAAQDGPMREAIAAMNHGDFAAAERQARAELRLHPSDAMALSLLGSALDGQQHYPEADEAHRRATAAAPSSPDIWNNFANHLLARNDDAGASQAYRKVIALDPANFNANVQLARIALRRKNGREALTYLDRLPDQPPIEVLRLEALYRVGDRPAAEALAASLSGAASTDLTLGFSAGVALANAEQFEKAEAFFSQALAIAPSDFNVLFNLGAVAARAGHFARARDVLNAAARQQPRNPDVLYQLAVVENGLHRPAAAAQFLVDAAKIDPRRADIQKLLAIAAADLGALDDSAAAWDRYLALVPGDRIARRERAYLDVQIGHIDRGLAGLRRYAAENPADPDAQYEIGMALETGDPAHALEHFDEALKLRPEFAAAHAARGSLHYQMGKPEAALPDLEAALAGRPGDSETLDRLGQVYGALGRPADAVRVLRRAADLAPDDSKVLLHYARALADAGQITESKAAMERFKQLGPPLKKTVPAGLLDYLALTPGERRANYRARVEKSVREHPDDLASQDAYLKLLLEDGNIQEAAAVGRRIHASGSKPLPPDIEADAAVAAFQAFASLGQTTDAEAALDRALRAAPDRADLYRQAAAFLLAAGKPADALLRMQEARQHLPRDRDIRLIGAVVFLAAGRAADAGDQVARALQQWPEWPAAWIARGLWLTEAGQHDEARAAFERAAVLGSAGNSNSASPTAAELLRKAPDQW